MVQKSVAPQQGDRAVKKFFVLGASLLVLGVCSAFAADEPFRPEAGKFPPLEKAHAYRGELVFVDHANRRGSIRVQGSGTFFRNDPHPFAMLPYGIVRYHGAPADLRDIPLGTMVHVRAFLPPDPKISAEPVLPVDNKKTDANHNRGAGIAPAENHVFLLEDEPSHEEQRTSPRSPPAALITDEPFSFSREIRESAP